MNNVKYVGLDIHQASVVAAVLNHDGKCIAQAVIETKASTIKEFIKGLSGEIHLTFEEGTQATWLFDIIKPLVKEVIVCNPRENHWLKQGNKTDKVDALKLAQLLRAGLLKAVYHGSQSVRPVKDLTHVYDQLTSDRARVINRLKSIYRSQAIECGGTACYQSAERERWLTKLESESLRQRAEWLLEELDVLSKLKRESCRAMVREAKKHTAYKWLETVPGIGKVAIAQVIAAVGSPYRFRTKRQFWTYCGLAVVTRSSADYEFAAGGLVRRKSFPSETRGLNENYNHRLKRVFKTAAMAAMKKLPFSDYYHNQIERGLKAELARVQLARKLAAIALAVWKKAQKFDAKQVVFQTA